jgi:hypothetical protein
MLDASIIKVMDCFFNEQFFGGCFKIKKKFKFFLMLLPFCLIYQSFTGHGPFEKLLQSIRFSL